MHHVSSTCIHLNRDILYDRAALKKTLETDFDIVAPNDFMSFTEFYDATLKISSDIFLSIFALLLTIVPSITEIYLEDKFLPPFKIIETSISAIKKLNYLKPLSKVVKRAKKK